MPTSEPTVCGPLWVRRRTIGRAQKRRMKTTLDLVQRLKQETCLNGHEGCVNCLEWNSAGDLLASGSDDSNIIVWDAFRATKRKLLTPGHEGIIFSVKFIPATNDTRVASCAGDGQVRVTHVADSESLLVCRTCHSDRVKRLAIHPSEPNLIWSAGEDGLVLQYDIRLPHVCNSTKPNNILIDLDTIDKCLAAKCITVNPLRSEMLAVGSNDIYNRLFDRRYIRPGAWSSCTAYFAPGHLPRTNNRSNHIQSYGTTYLTFNSDGSALLASVHAEQIYLYNTYEPWERYRSFDASIKPLLLDQPESKTHNPLRLKSYSYLNALREQQPVTGLPESLLVPELSSDQWSEAYFKQSPHIANGVVNHTNELLARISNSPDIYRTRAMALLHRGWRGDLYQALRDCCCALALQPLDFKTICFLATVLIRMGYREAAFNLLDFVELLLEQFPAEEQLLRTRDILIAYKRSPSPSRSLDEPVAPDRCPASLQKLIGQLSVLQYDCSTHDSSDEKESKRCAKSYDYSKRFCGHCNMNTDIKEANFFGANDEFIVGGSDDGALYIWDKSTTNIVKAAHADHQILNCVQPHPNICMLATSGIESSVKLWSSSGQVCRDVKALEMRCTQNHKYISTDPLEAMINMLYPSGAQ